MTRASTLEASRFSSPRYDLPEDGLKTLAATDGPKIGLSATGHAGYTPAALTSARLSYSYDGLTDAHGNSVTQTVVRADDVR
ncbi:hypothetical protein ACF06X_09460 [Streptomyces sp. NPDC015346]|uniref:hypothetical protein n=1 Tax=Streptomyces sp. NPDC015346 TaxID=3364954 RepID=UPI00370293C2